LTIGTRRRRIAYRRMKLTERESFEILGIAYGSGPEAIHQAYRDMVRVWHPDRFSHDARLQKIAEDKVREINLAYEVLQPHCGIETVHLAPVDPPVDQLALPLDSPEPSFTYHWPRDFRRPPNVVESSIPLEKFDMATRAKQLAANFWSQYRSLSWGRGAQLFGLLVVLFLLVRREVQIGVETLNQNLPAVDVAVLESGGALTASTAPNTVPQPAVNPSLAAVPVEDQERRESTFDPTAFTLGSTRDEVIALQGAPDRTTATSFHFGSSDVYFDEFGKVVGWANSKPRLKVALRPAAPTSNEFFTLGSTVDEVVAMQGTPDILSKDSYHYGSSEVNLEGSQVVGWSNAGRNLKAKLLPAKATEQAYFVIGSTTDEVLAVHGTPDRVSKNIYHYGSSYIIFDHGQVAEVVHGKPRLKFKMQTSGR